MTDQPGAPVPPDDVPTGGDRSDPPPPTDPTLSPPPAVPPAGDATTDAGADRARIPDPAWAPPARVGEPDPGGAPARDAPAGPDGAPATDAPAPETATAAIAPEPLTPPSATDAPTPASEGDPVSRPAGRGGGLRVLGYLAAAVAGAVLTVGLLAATGSLTATAPQPSPSPSPAYAADRSIGDPSAPVTIEIWADFQCPYCGLLARVVEPTIERTYAASGQALVTYRDFAFLGAESFDAAVAARCAGKQGAFWYMHDLLFASQQGENQGAFAADRLESLASFAGLDATAFSACVADPSVRQAVTDETAAGRALGIESTPTIRIVGPGGVQLIKGLKPFSEIEAAFKLASTPAASGSPGPSPTGSGPGSSPSGTDGSSASPTPGSASPSP
jgi:protein-disulfide isomerase